MALRYSTALLNFMAGVGSYKQAFQNGRIEVYSGAQPANAMAAVTGMLLCTFTNNAQAITPEVLSAGSVTLTGGAAGSVDTLTVNGIDILGGVVPFNTSLAQTATNIAEAINNNASTVEYTASATGAVVTITALPTTGTLPNGLVVASTATTLTKIDGNMAGGVAAVNGLKFAAASAGSLNKLATQVWSGVNAASGTAGWYRRYGSVADTGALDSANIFLREDGAISTAGAEMNMVNTAFTAAATTSLQSDVLTLSTL